MFNNLFFNLDKRSKYIHPINQIYQGTIIFEKLFIGLNLKFVFLIESVAVWGDRAKMLLRLRCAYVQTDLEVFLNKPSFISCPWRGVRKGKREEVQKISC